MTGNPCTESTLSTGKQHDLSTLAQDSRDRKVSTLVRSHGNITSVCAPTAPPGATKTGPAEAHLRKAAAPLPRRARTPPECAPESAVRRPVRYRSTGRPFGVRGAWPRRAVPSWPPRARGGRLGRTDSPVTSCHHCTRISRPVARARFSIAPTLPHPATRQRLASGGKSGSDSGSCVRSGSSSPLDACDCRSGQTRCPRSDPHGSVPGAHRRLVSFPRFSGPVDVPRVRQSRPIGPICVSRRRVKRARTVSRDSRPLAHEVRLVPRPVADPGRPVFLKSHPLPSAARHEE